MSFQARGGVPSFWEAAVDNAAGRYHLFPALTLSLKIKTDADLKVYLTEDDFTNDVNSRLIAAADIPEVEPMEVRGLWMKKATAGSANVSITAYHRKG